MLPKITIITPSYNQAEFLELTILSVIDQNYPNIEFIIIDGGSTDGSVDIIKKYEQYISYWVSEEDRGQSHAVLKGFSKATGDLIGWQNSDDIYWTNSFNKVARAFSKDPTVDFIYGNQYRIDNNGNITQLRVFAPATIDNMVYEENIIQNQSCFWRKSFLDKIGFLNENYHWSMDYDLLLRTLSHAKNISYVNSILGCFRHQPNAKTTSSNYYEKCRADIESSIKILGIKPVKWKQIKLYKSYLRNKRYLISIYRYVKYQANYLRNNKMFDLHPLRYNGQ